MDDFDQTSGTLARGAATSVVTVNRYADAGLLEFRRASDGTRLFRRGQEKRVRALLEARRPRKGRKAG